MGDIRQKNQAFSGIDEPLRLRSANVDLGTLGPWQLRGMANSIPLFCGRIKCGSASSTGLQILLGCSPRSTNMAASGGSAGVPDILAGRSPQSGPQDGDGLQHAAKQPIQERLYMPILSALVPRNARLALNTLLTLNLSQIAGQVRVVYAKQARRCT